VHELSICGSIVDIVKRHADGRPVDVVHLRVGQLRQIVPDTLIYCWGLVNADTELAASRLEVESIPARITCHDCGAEHEIGQFPLLVCAGCGSSHVQVVAGEEFLITSLDLAET
jgi:hydrogenase nickel incorporation protein HypA/HybF